MKKIIIALVALSSISAFAAKESCLINLDSVKGITSSTCEPQTSGATGAAINAMLETLNKKFSVTKQKLVTINYMESVSMELKSEAVYKNEKSNKKEIDSYTTVMTFVSKY